MSAGSWSWERCAAAAERLFAALDWRALGEIYFHDEGLAHWQARKARVLELGWQWAKELLRRVEPRGSSLHAGAGVAEVPVLLAERLVAGRTVRAVNTNRRECALLGAALREAGLADALAIEPVDAAAAAAGGGYDHVGCVSVFTDPESWPLLSDVAYGRLSPVQLDLERFAAEREQARALARALFAGLQRPGWITTTAEEVPWFLEQAGAAGVPLDVDEVEVEAAVVGDPIGFLRIG